MNISRILPLLGPAVMLLAASDVVGVEISLVPVGASGTHTIAGNEITVPAGASTVTLEIRLADWDPDRDGTPLLRTYQVQVDSSTYESGGGDALTVAEIPIACVVDADCPGAGAACLATGFCEDDGGFFIDTSHANFVFMGRESITAVDLSQPDIRLAALTRYPVDSVVDPGTSKYGGTLVLDIPAGATGTYTIALVDDIHQTVAADEDSVIILPLDLIPATITIIDDCNQNGILDAVDIVTGTSDDCNGNATPDECEPDCNDNDTADECDIDGGGSDDCNGNGVPDECEPADCNGNGIIDVCDIASGTSEDCDGNDIPDECQPDCNENGSADACDILTGASSDCDGNGIPDECTSEDCNNNGILDICDITGGSSDDVNDNLVPDECEPPTIALVPISATGVHTIDGHHVHLASGGTQVAMEIQVANWDLERDGTPALEAYSVQINSASFTSGDSGYLEVAEVVIPCTTYLECPIGAAPCEATGFCARNGGFVIDEIDPNFVFLYSHPISAVDVSQPDIRLASVVHPDDPPVIDPGVPKYAGALILDVSPDASGTFTVEFRVGDPTDTFLRPQFGDQIPGVALIPTTIKIQEDCNDNGIADAEDIANGTSDDCNGNAIPDECEPDCNDNDIADECDVTSGHSDDCNGNGVPDECEDSDCNDNGVLDSCDIDSGTSTDCDTNGLPDECELTDCNDNGTHDACDVVTGNSDDCDSNGIPDECEFEDCNDNSVSDRCEIADGTVPDANGNGIPDDCEPTTIALVPISAEGTHYLTDGEISVLVGGSRIHFEIQLSNWNLAGVGEPQLRAYQAQVDSASFSSGEVGALVIPNIAIPCVTDSDCPSGGSTCGVTGFCNANGAFLVNETRPDFVFFGMDAMTAVDYSEPDVRVAGVLFQRDDASSDTGAVKYAGSLILDVPADAEGTFTISLVDRGDATLMADINSRYITPRLVVPAVVHVIYDCNENGLSDAVEIAEGSALDANGNGIPDECEVPAPLVEAIGCRYFSVDPAVAESDVALRVSSPQYTCLTKYIAPGHPMGRLVDEPVFLAPATWGTVLVGDAEILPDTVYHVQLDIGGGVYGKAGITRTPVWGDSVGSLDAGIWTPADGFVKIIDIVSMIDRFRNLATAPDMARVDFDPEIPNYVLDILDITRALDAFQSIPYPFSRPCP